MFASGVPKREANQRVIPTLKKAEFELMDLAAGPFDQRNTVTVREANAIRDTWFRADLQEEPTRNRIEQLLSDYLDARLA
jgi:hypothetical protein